MCRVLRIPPACRAAAQAGHSTFRISKSSAFTLIEFLLAVVIFGIVIGVVLVSFLVSRSSFLSSDAYIQVQEQARRALDNMRKELREAGGSITVNPGGIQGIQFQVALGYNLTSVSGCPANQICWGATDQAGASHQGWSVRYRTSGTQLIRETLGGTDPQRILANNVEVPTTYNIFDYNSSTKTVTVQLRTQLTGQQFGGGSMSTGPTPLTTKIKFRNPG